jgi:ATP-dependent protease ClpP protease subunit
MRYNECLDRLEVIQTLEKNLQSKVITFYRNRNNAEGIINEDAVDDFQLALDAVGEIDPLVVIVDSIGGETYSGYKIASLLNDRVGSVCVVVPEQALSAATLITIAAKHIIMHPKATLSPVDPQYFYSGSLVSALDLMDSPDPVIKRKARRAIEQSKEYIQLLCANKIKEDKIADIIKRLLLEDKVHASHSSPIKAGEIRTLGFNLKIETPLDIRAIHNLYKRHHFCEHDHSITIEYLRTPIPNAEKPISILSGYCDRCGVYSDNLKDVNGQYLCENCLIELEAKK